MAAEYYVSDFGNIQAEIDPAFYAHKMLSVGFTITREALAANILNAQFGPIKLPISSSWRALYEQEREIAAQATGWVVGL